MAILLIAILAMAFSASIAHAQAFLSIAAAM
jgi:hypothetical protein